MKAISFSILCSLLLLLACESKKEEETNSIPQAVTQLLKAEHQANRFDGTIVVAHRNQVLVRKAIGLANRVWEIPMTMDARFDIASVNKSFIAALTLLAVEEGKWKLDDTLVAILQQLELTYKGEFHPAISLHQLLSHTSGLADYDAIIQDKRQSDQEFRDFKRLHFSNVDYLNFISELKPIGAPGKQFYYSNFAYHLLPILLEELYQKSFAELLQEKICEPLGLVHTFAAISNEEVHPKVVEAYQYKEKEATWYRNNFIDLTLGRRIFSTVEDLYKWADAMNDTRLLQKPSLQQMKTNHVAAIQGDLSYGYGWVVFDGKGDYKMGKLPIESPYIIHGGATEGYKSIVLNVNNGEWIVTLLSNVGNRTNELELTEKIITILLQKQ